MINEQSLNGATFFIDEGNVLSMTTDDLFALIDGPERISVHDLKRKVERSQDSLDPERERLHQERLKAHATFISAAQVVIDAYADENKPHPRWSLTHLKHVLHMNQMDRDGYIRHLDRYRSMPPEHMIAWKPMGGEPHKQRNDEYQAEVQARIDGYQAIIDQCIAIMKERGIEVPA